MIHTGGPNASPDIRYATIARLRHKDCEANGNDVYTDIWREWEGIRQGASEVLLIRLAQEGTICSVRACEDFRFRRT